MTKTTRFLPAVVGAACGVLTVAALAAPVTYNIDPQHTFPAFRADHAGRSTFTGRINETSGTIVLDKEAGTGEVNITMNMETLDFGIPGLESHLKTEATAFDTAKYPTATYTGKLVDFNDGKPGAVDGTLNWRGVSKPVRLTIEKFVCAPSGRGGGEVCGADAVGEFSRADFGANFGQQMGFDMNVKLIIQIEAQQAR